MPVKRNPDYVIMAAALTLLLFGLVMIFSSSAVLANQKFGDAYHFLKRQSLWALVGLCGMYIAMRIDYRILTRYSYPIFIVTIVGLLLVFTPGLGKSVNGAQRWVSFGFASFQPSEFAKLGVIIFFAAILARKAAEERLGDFFTGYLPLLTALGAIFLLIQNQPDLGTAVIISGAIFFLFVVSGVRYSHLFITGLIAFPLLVGAVYNVGYRRKRILAFLDPWQDMSDSGYQIIQSFIALSRGGFFGTGLGAGQQKLFFLPEPHTDFIFSIIAEEAGLIGAGIVILLFAVIAWRGLQVGLRAPDLFGSYLALGITFIIVFQALVNLSVAMGMLPTKGLPLPFVSLGGSALVMWLTSLGLLLNISEHTAQKGRI